MRTLWHKLMSSSSGRRWNPSLLNSAKESSRNFFPKAPLAPRQCASAAKSLHGLVLESLRRFLQKWPILLLIAQAVPLLTSLWKSLMQPMQSASMSLKRPAGLMRWHMIKVMVKIHSAILLLSELCNFRLPRVPNNPCNSIGMLNVDEGIVLVDNGSKIL